MKVSGGFIVIVVLLVMFGAYGVLHNPPTTTESKVTVPAKHPRSFDSGGSNNNLIQYMAII